MKRININILIAVFLIMIVAGARLVNASLGLHNLVPIAAVSLFSGYVLKNNRALAFLVPILGQFIADVLFQFYTYIPGFYWATDMLFNYAAIIGATALGMGMKNMKPLSIAGFTIGASLTFFLVSNFGYFAHGWNGYSFAGLTKTYVDAIPFYQNSFMADIVGAILFFGGYSLTQRALEAKTSKIKA